MSQQGFWIYDTAGNLKLGPDSSTVLMTATVETGTADGSYYDPMFDAALPMIIAVLPISGGSNAPPHLTFDYSGRRLVWSFQGGAAVSHRIVYGLAAG